MQSCTHKEGDHSTCGADANLYTVDTPAGRFALKPLCHRHLELLMENDGTMCNPQIKETEEGKQETYEVAFWCLRCNKYVEIVEGHNNAACAVCENSNVRMNFVPNNSIFYRPDDKLVYKLVGKIEPCCALTTEAKEESL